MTKRWLKVRSIALLVLVFLNLRAAHASWNPQETFLELEPSEFHCLEDPGYQKLKERVATALQGTWCSKEKVQLLMDVIALTRPVVCVEIGAFTGSSVLPIATALKHFNCGKLFAIEAWSNQEAVKHLAHNDPNKQWWSTVNMDEIRKTYDKMLNAWHLHSVCTTIHDSSEKAAPSINDIDFLHLDGDYSEEGSYQDLQLYLPKVNSGGLILLSNLFVTVNGKQPKLKTFSALFDACEMIGEIENDNAVLFKKL